MSDVPNTYPRNDDGTFAPMDSDAALAWLDRANDAELDWYYHALGV